MATGEKRGGICLTESNAGTDLQAITTTATRDGDVYRIDGSKMWITNARHGNTFLLLAKTDPKAQPAAPGHERVHDRKGRAGHERSAATSTSWDTKAWKLASCIFPASPCL